MFQSLDPSNSNKNFLQCHGRLSGNYDLVNKIFLERTNSMRLVIITYILSLTATIFSTFTSVQNTVLF